MASTAEAEIRGRRQTALVTLGQFALKTPDLTAVMREAVETVKRTLEVDLCAVLRRDPARGCLTVWVESGVTSGEDEALEVPLERSSHAGFVALSGQPAVVADIERETRFVWTHELPERGMRSGAVVPFGNESEALGVLAAHARQPERFAVNEVYFLESVANVLGVAVQRADAERRIDCSQRLLLEAIAGIADPFAIVGRDWRILYANKSFRQRLEVWRVDDAEGDFRRIPAWRQPEAQATFEAAMGQGTAGSFELNSEAEQLWFHVNVSANYDGLSVYFHNVGALVRRNRELATRARQQTALATVAEAAVCSADTDELLQCVVRVVAETLDVEFARVMELSEDRSSLILRAGVGWEAELVGSFVIPFDGETRIGQTLLKDAPAAIEEQRTEAKLRLATLLSSHGIISGVNVVIGSTDWPRGSLGVHSRRPRTYTNGEIVFLGSVASVLGTALERQRVFAGTQQLNRRLSDVLNSIGDPFWSVDRNWNLTYANAKFLEHIGVPSEHAIGRNVFEVAPLMPAETQAQLRRASAAAKPARFESPSGQHGRLFEIAASPTSDGMLFYSRDISERKEAEELVRTLNADLERRVAEQTAELRVAVGDLESFSYSVSHDLRAPLRAIDGFSLALLEDFGDDLEPEAKVFLERIRSAASRMGRLIDDLLKLSRISRRDLIRREFDLSEIALEVVAQLRESEPEREIEIAVEAGLRATGDRGLLRIALENLLGNAWKFTRKTAQPRIEVGMFGAAAGGVFFVRDNGVGFDMAYADKLFGAFQRLHAAEAFEGTGIGLATVQRIVRRHGGRVWVDAKVGGGATFFVSLEPSAVSPVA